MSYQQPKTVVGAIFEQIKKRNARGSAAAFGGSCVALEKIRAPKAVLAWGTKPL
jgi:hypothetical protein